MKKTYAASCTSTQECNTLLGLYCPSTSSCKCPYSAASIFCDCQRTTGNEYYWNGAACQAASVIFQPCTSSSTSYMCQTLTQNTICNNSIGQFQCECDFLNYYDSISNSCLSQLSLNGLCSSDSQCQTVYGLSCINGSCKYNISIINMSHYFLSVFFSSVVYQLTIGMATNVVNLEKHFFLNKKNKLNILF